MEASFSRPDDLVPAPCWKTIGIEGDRSCVKLRQYTHCRNCEVFADAAAALRDKFQPLSWYDGAEYAEQAPVEEHSQGAVSHLIFRLSDQWFTIQSRFLDLVIPPVAVRKVPNRHSATLLGVCNVRGQLLPWVSLHKLLSIAESDSNSAQARLLVLNHVSGHLVSQVDEIAGIQKLPSDCWQVPSLHSDQLVSQMTIGLARYQQWDLTFLDSEALMQTMLRELQ